MGPVRVSPVGGSARALALLCVGLALSLWTVEAGAQGLAPEQRARIGAAGKVDARVMDRLEVEAFTRVVIRAADRAALARLLARVPATERRTLRSYARAPLLALEISGAGLAALAEDPSLGSVAPDVRLDAQLGQALPLTNTDRVHSLGYTGSAVEIAYVDTGIDTDHPLFAGAIVAEQCFCDDQGGPDGCCPNGLDTQSGSGAGEDDNNHGTRVAGILRANGVLTGGAPDASLVVVKALDSTGSGFLSDIVAGIDWIDANQPGVSVVNLSFGSGLYAGVCDDDDAVTQALAAVIDPLVGRGVLVVAGSGNNASGTSMITPACLAGTFSVGAVWDADLGSESHFGCTDPTTQPDQVPCWSNSSVTTDLLAPGGRIRTAGLAAGTVDVVGTSYATPLTAACGALLQQAAPGVSLTVLSSALRSSNTHVFDAKNGSSLPRLDCLRALKQLVPVLPALPGGAAMLLATCLLLAVSGVARLRRAR